MKSLFVLAFIAVSAINAPVSENSLEDQGLEMQLTAEIEFQQMVKVYDYQGKLMKEYFLSDVVNNNITVTDHILIEGSDFAFDYLGDYYYFSEDLLLAEVN